MMNWLLGDPDIFQSLIRAFCWMLLHSLWQGVVLTLLAGLVMLFTRRAAAKIRYDLLAGLFLLFLVGCLSTLIYEWRSVAAEGNSLPEVGKPLQGVSGGLLLDDIGAYCSAHAGWIMLSWCLLFGFKCWQMGRGVLYMRRLRGGEQREVTKEWQLRLAIFTERMGIDKSVRLLESGITKVPVLVGHFKPVIYMPLGLLVQLPPEQIEAVLMHELAHIRRNDYLVNLLQYGAEAVFCFNPGLLWVSSLLRQEREHCCDDMALRYLGRKKQFIQALISFKEYALYGAPLAPAFAGRKQHLLQRVSRLVQERNAPLNVMEKTFCIASLFIAALLAGVTGTREVLSAKAATLAVQRALPRDTARPVMIVQPQVSQPAAVVTAGVVKSIPAPPKPMPAPAPPVPPRPTTLERQAYATQQRAYEQAKEAAIRDREQYETDRLRFEQDKATHTQYIRERMELVEATKQDRIQADKDRAQAAQDCIQAEKDRQQAELDRIQADKDRRQADKDRAQAALDRLKAEKDRVQADKDIANALLNNKQVSTTP